MAEKDREPPHACLSTLGARTVRVKVTMYSVARNGDLERYPSGVTLLENETFLSMIDLYPNEAAS